MKILSKRVDMLQHWFTRRSD